MNRKYEIWKDIDLDADPIIGKGFTPIPILDNLILSLQDFSSPQLLEISNFKDVEHIRRYVDQYYKRGFLTRYTGTEKFNVYRYTLTDLGKLNIK